MNPNKLKMFKDRALDYQKNRRSYSWLFDRRQVLNEELNRFYSLATPGEQATYLFQHPGFEADKAEADAIRDVIYPQMDRAAQKPAGYYANLATQVRLNLKSRERHKEESWKTGCKRKGAAWRPDQPAYQPLYSMPPKAASRDSHCIGLQGSVCASQTPQAHWTPQPSRHSAILL